MEKAVISIEGQGILIISTNPSVMKPSKGPVKGGCEGQGMRLLSHSTQLRGMRSEVRRWGRSGLGQRGEDSMHHRRSTDNVGLTEGT